MPEWSAVALYELRWLPRRMGGWRGLSLYFGFLAIAGYLFPVALRLDFISAQILLVYACSGPFFVSSVAVEALSDTREIASPLASLGGRLLAVTLFGWLSAILLLTIALVTVNLTVWQGAALIPDARFLSGVLLFGLSLTLLTTAFAAVLCLSQREPRRTKKILKNAYVIALVAAILLIRYGEVEWQARVSSLLEPESITRYASIGTALLLAAAAVLIATAARHPRYR